MVINRDGILLDYIVEHCDKIIDFVKDTTESEFTEMGKSFDAILFNIMHIGENVKRLSPEIKEKYKNVGWKKISGMRDIIAHSYYIVNPSIVWTTVNEDIVPLRNKCVDIIKKEFNTSK